MTKEQAITAAQHYSTLPMVKADNSITHIGVVQKNKFPAFKTSPPEEYLFYTNLYIDQVIRDEWIKAEDVVEKIPIQRP